HLYNDYMGDQKKSTSLFTKDDDNVDDEKKEKIKRAFKVAQFRGSILWQDVVSFDNKWLAENGIYDPKTKVVDEKRLKDITRVSMEEMLRRNHIQNNTLWSGAIHHNTDNIHIHLATVELSPNKYQRGKRKLKTLEQMKSKYINKIMDRSKEHEKINDIIRNQIVKDKKRRDTFGTFNRTFKKNFMSIYNQLPENRKYWNYSYTHIHHLKHSINNLSTEYMNKYYKKELNDLNEMLDTEEEVFKKAYGKGQFHKYKDYKKNKKNDLYKRIGNAFLQEMKEYDKKVKSIDRKNYPTKKISNKKIKNMKKSYAFNKMKYDIDSAINSELNRFKNQRAYEQLQKDVQREHTL